MIRNIRLRQTAYTAIDVISGFLRPVATVQLAWAATALIIGGRYSPTANALVGSPSRAATTVFTYFFTAEILGPIVEMVYQLVFEILLDNIEENTQILIIK